MVHSRVLGSDRELDRFCGSAWLSIKTSAIRCYRVVEKAVEFLGVCCELTNFPDGVRENLPLCG
jgi:hypothetical protein